MIEIDGAFGEGGGQIIRTSLSLSAITGEPVHIRNVRANRNKPGLLRQHLTALNAVTDICGGRADGAELGSREITLYPGSIRTGSYRFAVGSAGSANLVLQTVLPVLMHAEAQSDVTLQGGTHNPSSPPFDFLAESFLPAIRTLGYNADEQLNAYGFYPAGGGEVQMTVKGRSELKAADWVERGEETSRTVEAMISNLPGDIARRELSTVARELGLDRERDCRIRTPDSIGPGNALIGRLGYGDRTTVFVQFGERNVSSEQVAKRLAKQMKSFIGSGAAIDHHLADQLLLPMALAKGGVFSTTRPSQHTLTNADVIAKFTGRKITFQEDVGRTICEVR